MRGMKLLAMAGNSHGGHNREEAKSDKIKRDQARSSEVIPCQHQQMRGNACIHVVMEWSFRHHILVKNRHAVLRADN